MTRESDELGFTLIEVLVALLILALAMGAAFPTLSGGAAAFERSQQQRDALVLAESTLARIGHTFALRPGHLADAEGEFVWTVDIGSQLEDPPPAGGLASYPVQVAVRWRDDHGGQELRLNSVRLGPRQVDR